MNRKLTQQETELTLNKYPPIITLAEAGKSLNMNISSNKIYQGNCIDILRSLPKESIDCIMTSPPYWALRDYGSDVECVWRGKDDCNHEFIGNFCTTCGAWKGQLGLEPTFDLYIKHLCDIFDEVKRVLKNTGTCWVNLGDTYSKSSGQENQHRVKNLPPKSLCNIPHRFAIEMTNRGWILRNTIIWYKPNAMPSSVKDRFTVDFEYVFFFSKKKKYYFKTQYEPHKQASIIKTRETDSFNLRVRDTKAKRVKYSDRKASGKEVQGYNEKFYKTQKRGHVVSEGCNCNSGFVPGIVLDPFAGAGTTLCVAKKLNRDYIGIEIKEAYIDISEKRLDRLSA